MESSLAFKLHRPVIVRADVPQLFVDDFLIDTTSNLHVRSHVTEKLESGALDLPAEMSSELLSERDGHGEEVDPSVTIKLDEDDEPNKYIEHVTGGLYAGIHFALLHMGNRHSGLGQVQWACSRDGCSWQRCFRKPLISAPPRSNLGQFQVAFPRLDGDLMVFGVSGSTTKAAFAVLRRDGWVSLDGGDHTATMVTRVFKCPASGSEGIPLALYVNSAVESEGQLTVSVLDKHGRAWPQLDAECNDPLTASGTRLPVTWNGGRSIEEFDLAGEWIRLRFDLIRCSLYSFGFFGRRY